MKSNPSFTVLIERRRLRTALGWMLVSATLLAASFGLQTAHAAPSPASKIAADLQQVLATQGQASPTAESAPAADGAFFSPFAMAPTKPARLEPERAWYLSTGNADLTFSVAASLAAVAAFAYLLRRASR